MFHDVKYYTLSEAKATLNERRLLRPTIEQWWKEQGWTPPNQVPMFGDAVAVLGKAACATRRYEDALFLEYARLGGFNPAWMVYTKGLLSTESPFKRRLLHPTFFEKRGKRYGGIVVRKHRLGCIESNRAKPVCDVRLKCGTPVVDFHRRLHQRFGYSDDTVIDLSSYYEQFAYNAKKYYWGYLSFFLAHSVLLDDYHGGEERLRIGMRFTNEVFLPVYHEVVRKFGITPIIVRFPWHEHLKYVMPDDVENWRDHRVIPENLLDLSHHF